MKNQVWNNKNKMAKKLKCWKKSNAWGSWRNVKNPKKIVDITDMGARRYTIETEKGFNAEGLIGIESSKVKALARAKSYMKKHDKC